MKSSAGVDQINLEFLDDRLITVYVHYNDLPFKDYSEFLDAVSNSMRLPRKAWKLESENLATHTYEIDCGTFKARLDWQSGFNGSASINDAAAETEKLRRVEEQNRAQKKVFKP